MQTPKDELDNSIGELMQDDVVHVYPLYGSEHVFDGPCWCDPCVEYFGKGEVIVHSSDN